MSHDDRLSAAQFRRALDGLLEGVQIIDRDLRYVYVNPAAAAQGRQAVADVIGRRLLDIFPRSEGSEYLQALRQVLAGAAPRSMHTAFPLPDGTVGHYQLSIEPIEDGVFVLSVETTAQVEAEAKLAEARDRYRALLEGLPELVFLLDRDGLVLDLHAPSHTPLFVPADQIVGRPLADLLPAPLAVQLREAMRCALRDGRIQLMNYENQLPDGLHHFEASIVPGDADRVTIVARDVTARVKLEDQLRQAQKMEAIGQLTGGIAHDFNNVLQVIRANAELLQASLSGHGAAPPPELLDVLGAARRGADMVAQLLQFSRRGVLRRESVDPRVVLERAVSMLRRLLTESIAITVDPIPKGVRLSLDVGSLEQILANLCTNARDAMPGGGTVAIRTAVCDYDARLAQVFPWLAAGRYFRISVCDSGSGMSEETRERIFEPFFTTKPLGSGTGLGMAMVYGLMKSHDGAVDVESALGVGTRVHLYFPILEDDAVSVSGPTVADAIPALPGGDETVLLAEDDPSIRMVTRRMLERRGYHVIEAADGALGLEEFERHAEDIALVISDLVMPNMSGREMVDGIRAIRSQVPVLFMSGYSDEAFFGDGVVPERTSFLTKPWALADFLPAVRRAIDGETT